MAQPVVMITKPFGCDFSVSENTTVTLLDRIQELKVDARIHHRHETLIKLLELANDQSKINKEDALFEESYHRRDEIIHLPIEATCWCIGDTENLLYPDGQVLRLMTVVNVSPVDEIALLASIASKATMSYKEQAMRLFYHTCLNPPKKKRRRPYHVILRNSKEAKDVVLDVVKFGIHFHVPGTSQDLILNAIENDDAIWFRRCFCCGLTATDDMFLSCPGCKAVLYCDEECQMNSWTHRHKNWCKKFEKYMEMENDLSALPFAFTDVTTHSDFSKQRWKCFLQENDVYGRGLWIRESPSSSDSNTNVPFGELEYGERPYVLPLEEAVLETPPAAKEPPSLEEPLHDWRDYYNYRGFLLDSPIAALLHYALTLYWIITHLLPKHYPLTFRRIIQSKIIHVHIIGAEKEADLWKPFLECARLLAPFALHLYLFGDELSKHIDGQSHSVENLTFQFHHGLYHQQTLQQLPPPDLAIGFNAGLSAYTTFVDTVKMLLDNKTPFFCTDYCFYSIAHSNKALQKSHAGTMLKPVINPFRSPFRIVSAEMNLPRYSNAFAYCLKPYKMPEKGMLEDTDQHSKEISNTDTEASLPC